ncbi:hypothetical protein BCL76_10739 [Streptomyces sp. CG 926]|nr:hypothetical protein BCL76_10739 [Streptomyces sp. CG 926]
MVIPGQRGTEGPGNRPRGAAIRSSCRRGRGRGRCLGPRLRHAEAGGAGASTRGGASGAREPLGRHQRRVWGLPVSLIVSPCRAGPSRALLLRRRVATRWPAATLDRPSRPGHTKTVGKPPKERAGRRSQGRGHHRSPGPVPVGRSRDEAMTAPGRVGGSARFAARCSRPSARRPAWAGHKPPTSHTLLPDGVRRLSVVGHRSPTSHTLLPDGVRRLSVVGHRSPTSHALLSDGVRRPAVAGHKPPTSYVRLSDGVRRLSVDGHGPPTSHVRLPDGVRRPSVAGHEPLQIATCFTRTATDGRFGVDEGRREGRTADGSSIRS